LRHQLTAKSRFEGFIGTDIRDFDGESTISSEENLIYGLNFHWQATARTGFEAAFTRNVNPSVTSVDESYEATAFKLGMNASVSTNWFFNAHVQYEKGDYFSNLIGGTASREDDYLSAGVALSRSVKLTRSLAGSRSFFYDYRENDSSLPELDYDQHITGVKFGVSF
jgi:hypothetical protein